MTDHLETEVLIIGCGIAGGIAALELATAGISVTIVTRAQQPEESNTLYAQGGIIYKGENDSPALLEEDLLRAGAGHSNPKTVRIMAGKGPEMVEKILLKKLELNFDVTAAGEYSLVTEARRPKLPSARGRRNGCGFRA